MDIDNRELRTAREVGREIGALLSQLEGGSLQKVVIVQGAKMRAVILTVEDYERLLGAEGQRQAASPPSA